MTQFWIVVPVRSDGDVPKLCKAFGDTLYFTKQDAEEYAKTFEGRPFKVGVFEWVAEPAK